MAGGGGALSSILGVCKRKYREPGFLVDSVVLSQSSPTFAPHPHPSRHLGANWKSGPQSLVLVSLLDQGELDYQLQDQDSVLFISTLHGG